MFFNSREYKFFKQIRKINYVNNIISLFFFILFVLIVWQIELRINENEVKTDQISNYEDITRDPNEKIEEFKKGSVITDTIEKNEFVELEIENNLIKEGVKVKDGNLFIKKF